MIKLLVSDFDGTLLPYGQKALSEKTVEYIKCIIGEGITFAVASGRTYSELHALLGDLADDIYFICDDGALTVKKGNVIFKKQFSRSSMSVFFDSDIYKNVVFYSLDKAYLWSTEQAPLLYGKTPCRISRLIEIKDDIFKITANAKRFDLISTRDFRMHYSDGTFAEFVNPYANKGVAVADLQLKLGISKFETMAIGDAGNDIAMMSHAKYSCCVSDRSKELDDICKYREQNADTVLYKVISHTFS